MKLPESQALAIVRDAVLAAGGSPAMAESLARAVVAAEWAGNSAVGFAHLPDYLDGLGCGRIRGDAQPQISSASAACIHVDAQHGIAQLGFDLTFEDLVARARTLGVALFIQSRSFTVGELGYYTRRLAEQGLIALATCNATAQMTTAESGAAVFGTNPMSFAAPTGADKPFVIDQASSAAAFVRIREAAARGEMIPAGWAVNAAGLPTTEATEAVNGCLLPFGGARGAHVAMMVEILSAGLSGSNWSMDAPSYASGSDSPSVGMSVVAIRPDLVIADFGERLRLQVRRLADAGVRIPGSHIQVRELDITETVLEKVASFGCRGAQTHPS